jgi:anti-sigma factor RsiW
MMDCIEYEEWISADLDGELAPEDGARLREHLSACARCRQAVEDSKLNRILIRGVEARKAPADAFARLTARLEGGERKPAPPRPAPIPVRRSPLHAWLKGLQAVACIAVIFVGVLAWLGFTDADEVDTVPLIRQVSVRPKALMRGHAYLQAANPVADGSAWHYLASEDENGLPAGDDEEDLTPSLSPYRGM